MSKAKSVKNASSLDSDFRYIFALFSIPFAAALGAVLSQFELVFTVSSFAAFFLFLLYSCFVVIVGGLAFKLIAHGGYNSLGLIQALAGTTPLSALVLFLWLGNSEDMAAITAGIMLLMIWFLELS